MKKIRRRCKCGCGRITNYGRIWISGHNARKRSRKTRKKLSLAQIDNTNMLGKKHSKETKRKLSLVKIGNTIWLGRRHTEETKKKLSLIKQNISKGTKLKLSLANMKYDPNYPYCDVWKDREYKKDIRKDYCENADCKKNNSFLCNHHIYLDKKRCAPNDIMTMCNSCHLSLHTKLAWHRSANPKDYIIINRPDHISYIHKKTHKAIGIKRWNHKTF